MSMERIALSKPIAAAYADELSKRLFFVSGDILDFKLDVHDNQIHAIEVTTPAGCDIADLARKVNYVITNDILTQKLFPPKVIWQAQPKRGYEQDVFERLLEREMVFEAGEGQVSLGETLIGLMDALDARLKHMAASLLGAREYRYPTVIPTRVMEECGYFKSFPHMLMFVTRLHNDVDVYKAFAAEYQAQGHVDAYALAHCQNMDYCLPPTMCYHTYHQLRNRQLSNQVVTSKGKSFRFESKYHRGMERLWDFTIREIVFMGSKEYVLDCRHTYMQATFALMEELGLSGYCEVASDPFFCTLDTAAKIFSQKMMELKYELRLNIGEGRTIASGSFNFHERFFGENFKISYDDQAWIHTGCVGVGLERLVYAFVCHHGLDQANWPPIVIPGEPHVASKS